MSTEILAPALALFSGVFFGLVVHIQRRGLGSADPLVGAFLSVGAMALMLWLMAPFLLRPEWFLTHAALILAMGGLIFPAAGQALQIYSIGHVGPSLTSAIGAFTPLFAVVPAILVLGEPFGPVLAVGIALMIAGLVLSALGPRRIARGWPLWVLLLPLGAALARGLAQPITKLGLTEVPSPYFATLVFATVSSLVLAGLLLVTGRAHRVRNTSGFGSFALSGLVNGTGILVLNAAIGMSSVTLTAPLASMSPFWALALGYLVFKTEQLGLRHLIVALLVVAGSVLIILH